jgi:translation elongation factor EF-4
VPKDAKLSLDNVALEAGRGKGTIKRGRPVYTKLIEEIRIRAGQIEGKRSIGSKALADAKLSAQKARLKSKKFEGLYKDSIARELMLLRQIDELRKALSAAGNVTSIRKLKKPNS